MRLDAVQRKLVKIDNFSKTLHLKKYYKKILKLMYNNRLNVIMQKYKTGTVSTKDLNDLDKMIKIGKLMEKLGDIIKK
jgi:uncharacterized protein YjaZ